MARVSSVAWLAVLWWAALEEKPLVHRAVSVLMCLAQRVLASRPWEGILLVLPVILKAFLLTPSREERMNAESKAMCRKML